MVFKNDFGSRSIATVLLFSVLILVNSVTGADLVKQALTDIQILYLYDNAEAIDWPTIYYLNEEYGCRVDLLTAQIGTSSSHEEFPFEDEGIYLHHYQIDGRNLEASREKMISWVMNHRFALRRPDVVIMGSLGDNRFLQSLAEKIRQLPPLENSPYNVVKIYHQLAKNDDEFDGTAVTVNPRELYNRYVDRMKLEIPRVFDWFDFDRYDRIDLVKYELIVAHINSSSVYDDVDFLSGLKPLRMESLFTTYLDAGALRNSFIKRVKTFQSSFGSSRQSSGIEQVRNLVNGFKEVVILERQVMSEPALKQLEGFTSYLKGLTELCQRATLKAIGLSWFGEIILRDSPHGPKLKFRASVAVDGPREVELSYIRFEPYWDSTEIVLDSISRKIQPHHSFVREYLVDIDRERLEARMPESLSFTAEIVYGAVPLKVKTSLPIWEKPDLSITFEPDFFFVSPVARIDVDRVVASMNWKAVIHKPLYYSGTVQLALETPRGVFAGAYRQEWQLEKERSTETVRIPFSVSNLFELGIHNQTIKLIADGKEVASDTGRIRIAACEVGDTINIGLMPDSTGLLEDILRMARANYWPLTDRALQTGDLDAYDVILVGTGALRDYPSFREISGRLEDYIQYGGSLIILGQPDSWSEGLLPVSFVPSEEVVAEPEILNRIPTARITSRPYKISQANLLGWLGEGRRLNAAVISPAEKVLVTPSGATLLSVSRLGEGQLIFCGLPLVEMISGLNIEAIHLLANLLNY